MQATSVMVFTLHLVSAVRVFEMQSSILSPPRNDTFIRFHISPLEGADGERQEELHSYSICYRFMNKVLSQFELHWSFSTQFDSNEILFGREKEDVLLIFHGVYYTTEGEMPQLSLHRWVHWCWVHHVSTTTLYQDGIKLLHFTGPPTSARLNGTLIIGQEQDETGGGFIKTEIFRGYFTQGNMWSYLLDEHSILKMSRCEVDLRGDVFSTDISTPYLANAVESNVDLLDLCQNGEKSFAVSSSMLFSEAIHTCQSFGSVIFAPRNREENEALRKHSIQFADSCIGSFWVGISDKAGDKVWRGFFNDSILPTFFDTKSTGLSPNCAVMASNKGSWLHEYCDSGYTRCFDCFLTYTGVLSLKGLCFGSYAKSLFDVRGYRNEKPYFHGFYGYIIFYATTGEWSLLDTIQNKTLATLKSMHENGFPIGRTIWKLSTPICRHSRYQEIQLALSQCNAQEYMCSDGRCISSASRCNGFADCSDQTDEEDCSIVHTPKSYLVHIPPTDGNTSDRLSRVSLNTSFTIQRFRNIIDAKHSFEMEFILSITWKDPRLTFYNIKNDSKDNQLSDHETSRIWMPSVFFDNTLDDGVRELAKSVRVTKESPPLPSDFNSAKMETEYAGSGAYLLLSQRLSGTFSCRFNVFQYPLDKQECSVALTFSTGRPQNITVHYVGADTLHEFRVTDFTVSVDDTEQRAIIQVHFRLQRLSNFIMLSVLLPSVMLQIIGYATLFIKPNLLQVRLTITLTTLLVLYTLFSQTSLALPKTSYIKMIDVWFFFCIFVLFVIIILHVVVDRLDKKTTPSPRPTLHQVTPINITTLKAATSNKVCPLYTKTFNLPTDPPEQLLFIARAYLFPFIVVPITIIFWVIMNWN